MGTLTAKDSDAPATATAIFKDGTGAVVAPDDIPVWASNDPTIVDIASTDAAGVNALLKYGIPGSATITATSHDTDGTVVVCSGAVIITAGEATSGDIEFAVPTEPVVVPQSDPTSPSSSASAPPASSVPGDTATGDGSASTPIVATLDPATQLPLYALAAGTDPATIDSSVWTAVSDVTDTDGTTLYVFKGDTAGNATPTGASSVWLPVVGAVTPVATS